MRPARRRSVLILLGISCAAAAALPIVAAAGPGPQAPDLRADPVQNVEGPAVYSDTEGGLGNNRLLVRFEGYVTNVGQGPLEVSGNPQVAGGVLQRARRGPGQPVDVVVGAPQVRFESADSHNHFHLMRAMRYSLWNLERTAQVAPSQKVGFCLYDIEPAAGAPVRDPQTYTASVTQFCDQGNPRSTDLRMGTSPGWRDIYDKSLAYQWIDVSETAPGTYLVGAEADPDGTIWEGGGAAESNAPAFSPQQVTVPGWLARPVAASQTGGAQTVTLTAQQVGSTGPVRYRIVSPPANGTLNVAAGQNFAGPTVTYAPRAGYLGADSFSYVALSSTSPFPLTPPAATVSIADRTPSIAITGAPARLVAGVSVQLGATVMNLPDGVTWSATAGRISRSGLYVAPATPPPGGSVTVRATSSADPSVAAEALIEIAPAPVARPRPGVAGSLSAGRKMLSPLRIGRVGRRIVVGKVVTGRRGGRVTITVTVGRRVLGRCTARIGARRPYTCKVTLKRAYPLTKVRVTAKLTVRGGKSAVRRAFVIRSR